MARITEEASATVTMNMEPARKSLNELKESISSCRDKLAQMMAEPEQKRDMKGIKDLEAKIAQLEKQEKSATEKLQTFRDTLKNLNAASFNQLYKASKELESQIKRLAPGTKEYIAASHDLQMVRTRIADLRKGWAAVSDEQQRARFSLKGIADGFNRYWTMFDTLTRTISGLSMTFRKSAEDAARLDDVYADVMKTTGLLHEEVKGLDEELMKMDTRTSREQLLLLARDAGKLGITGKENILGFVRAADQIQVALGEDLGEGAIKQLGKIADVYGLTGEMGIEKSLLSIASAVNALGQASTASEGYLVEFTQRLAGVGAMAGISVQDILGFASGLDQSSMKVEMAATAFQKFLMKMYEDTATFANYAGMEVEEFSELLKNDANAAITTVLKTLNGTGGFNDLVPMFNEMGLDGARAVQVLAAMAKNLEAVTDAQALANAEFEKATSVTEEYSTKNNNLQAQLEKARKEFHNASVALGQSLNPVMLKSTKITTYLIKALVNYGKEIKTVLVVIAALTVALKAKAIWLKVVATWNATLKAGSYALAAAQALLAGNVTRAAAAWRLMNTAMKASVIGVAVAAASALWIAIDRLVKKSREANETMDKMAEIDKRINDEFADGAGKVRALTDIVHNNNIELDQRRRALDELKKIVPGYHADLTKEGKLINDNTDALKDYIKNLEKATRAKILEEEYTKATESVMSAEKALEDAQGNSYEVLKKAGSNKTHKTTTRYLPNGRAVESYGGLTEYGQAKEEENKAADNLNKAKEIQLEIMKRIEKEQIQITNSAKETLEVQEEANTNGGGGDTDKDKDAEKRYQKALKDLEMYQRAEQNLINRQFFDKAITAEEHERQLRDITMKYLQEKLQLAKDNGKDTTQIEAAIIKERMANRKTDYDNALKQLQACQKDEENALAMSLAAQEITEKEYQSQMLEVKMRYLQEKLQLAREAGQDETDILQAILNAQLEAQKAANEEMKKLKEEAKKVVEGLMSPSEARDAEMQAQLKRLDELHDAMLLSEQQYEEAVKQLRKKYADADLEERLANVQKYAQQVSAIMSEASNFVAALKEAESAQLEAEYQRQITAAGDNAEQREAIEAEYEQKQLDLKKKYADTEMAINIAKTIASGAVAAIKAYAEGGPYLGIALAALIAATTAAEVATIVAQRNAIKNTSTSGGASTGSPSATLVTPTGYSEGGFTGRSASDSKPVGIVHANEWVAPAYMVRRNPVLFANLEQYRLAGGRGRSGSASRGFAEGGFTGSGAVVSDAISQKMLSAIERLETTTAANAAAINRLQEEGVPSYMVYDQYQSFDTQRKRFKNATSR